MLSLNLQYLCVNLHHEFLFCDPLVMTFALNDFWINALVLSIMNLPWDCVEMADCSSTMIVGKFL